MKYYLLLASLTFVLLGFSNPASAFECPRHFKATQAAIDSATQAMAGVKDGQMKGLVHTLIDESKMLLSGAKHNHAKPAAGKYDHARSIAKADSALAFAKSAEILAKNL